MSLGVLSGDVLGVVRDEAYYRNVETLRERFPWGEFSEQTKLLQQQTNESLAQLDCKQRVAESGIVNAQTCGALEWRRQSGDTHLSALIDASCQSVGPLPCPAVQWKSKKDVQAEVARAEATRPWIWGIGAVAVVAAVVAIRRRQR